MPIEAHPFSSPQAAMSITARYSAARSSAFLPGARTSNRIMNIGRRSPCAAWSSGSSSSDVEHDFADGPSVGDVAQRVDDLVEPEACADVGRDTPRGEQLHQLALVASELIRSVRSERAEL